MTYREQLQRYRDGALSEAEMTAMSKDIEKHEAISDYLLDQAQLPELEELSQLADHAETESDDFTNRINAYIRKVFTKISVIVAAAVLVTVLLTVFALPKLVDCFYYNPAETVCVSQSGIKTNRMTVDLSVYSELFLPEYYRDSVNVESDGWGKYSVYIPQTCSYTDFMTDVAGRLDRGKLTLYNPNVLSRPVGNAFLGMLAGVEDYFRIEGLGDISKESFDALKNLDEHKIYTAYVTLDTVMTYDDFMAWCNQNDIAPDWCALCVAQKDAEAEFSYCAISAPPIGFRLPLAFSSDDDFDVDGYPYLSQVSINRSIERSVEEENDWGVSSDVMTQHVTSLLQYTVDHPQFTKVMDPGMIVPGLADAVQQISQEGLHLYGFTATMTKSELQNLAKCDHVAYIQTQQVQ